MTVALPAWAAPRGPSSLDLEIASGPDLALTPRSPAGALWSLAVPGGGQFYAGDPVRGWVYLGLGLGGGLAGFGAMISQVPGGFTSSEEMALSLLVGYGVMLAVEGVSTVDALVALNSQGPADLTPAPSAVAPTPAWTPTPVWTPTPARAPAPAWTLPPVVLPVEVPTIAPAAAAPPSLDSDSQHVLQAYREYQAGDAVSALHSLSLIRSLGFAPKVQALTRQWGPAAAAQLVDQADRLARQGKTEQAVAALSRALALPCDPAVRSRAQALRDRLAAPPSSR